MSENEASPENKSHSQPPTERDSRRFSFSLRFWLRVLGAPLFLVVSEKKNAPRDKTKWLLPLAPRAGISLPWLRNTLARIAPRVRFHNSHIFRATFLEAAARSSLFALCKLKIGFLLQMPLFLAIVLQRVVCCAWAGRRAKMLHGWGVFFFSPGGFSLCLQSELRFFGKRKILLSLRCDRNSQIAMATHGLCCASPRPPPAKH